MKYLVIGAGGTGGSIGAYMARAGKDVTILARGEHLRAMKAQGLTTKMGKESWSVPVRAVEEIDYQDSPDVIFVCVKGYSLDSIVPLLERVARAHTVIIPILNIYGTGRELQKRLPNLRITDGCIYIAAQKERPGVIFRSGDIFRVVFGLRKDASPELRSELMPILKEVEQDLREAEILPILSDFVERDCLQKFSFVSPMAALGAAYGYIGGDYHKEGRAREQFVMLVKEIEALSHAMQADLPGNIVEINLKIMDDLAAGATASMQRDIAEGKPSEVDGLVYQVCRYGKEFGVSMPGYEMVAGILKEKV